MHCSSISRGQSFQQESQNLCIFWPQSGNEEEMISKGETHQCRQLDQSTLLRCVIYSLSQALMSSHHPLGYPELHSDSVWDILGLGSYKGTGLKAVAPHNPAHPFLTDFPWDLLAWLCSVLPWSSPSISGSFLFMGAVAVVLGASRFMMDLWGRLCSDHRDVPSLCPTCQASSPKTPNPCACFSCRFPSFCHKWQNPFTVVCHVQRTESWVKWTEILTLWK